MRKLLFFFLTAVVFLAFSACAKDPYREIKASRPSYDFLTTTASVHPQDTMRKQRDMAFTNAKYRLKSQVKEELKLFLEGYLMHIGVTNEKVIEKLVEYIYMDMEPAFDAVEQSDIRILNEKLMEISVRLNKAVFVEILKEAITLNFKRDRTVWDRYQEQSAQDMLKASIDALVSAVR